VLGVLSEPQGTGFPAAAADPVNAAIKSIATMGR